MIGKIFAGLVMGVVVALLSYFVFAIGSAGGVSVGGWAALGSFLLTLLLAITAQRARYAWGRGFLVAGLLCFALPLATIVMSGAVGMKEMGQATSQAGRAGAAAGSFIGGAVVTVVSGVVGFFTGAIFLIIAYFLLRTPRIIVQTSPAVSDGANTKKCPSCAELIKSEAVKCRYCGTELRVVPA